MSFHDPSSPRMRTIHKPCSCGKGRVPFHVWPGFSTIAEYICGKCSSCHRVMTLRDEAGNVVPSRIPMTTAPFEPIEVPLNIPQPEPEPPDDPDDPDDDERTAVDDDS